MRRREFLKAIALGPGLLIFVSDESESAAKEISDRSSIPARRIEIPDVFRIFESRERAWGAVMGDA